MFTSDSNHLFYLNRIFPPTSQSKNSFFNIFEFSIEDKCPVNLRFTLYYHSSIKYISKDCNFFVLLNDIQVDMVLLPKSPLYVSKLSSKLKSKYKFTKIVLSHKMIDP